MKLLPPGHRVVNYKRGDSCIHVKVAGGPPWLPESSWFIPSPGWRRRLQAKAFARRFHAELRKETILGNLVFGVTDARA